MFYRSNDSLARLGEGSSLQAFRAASKMLELAAAILNGCEQVWTEKQD